VYSSKYLELLIAELEKLPSIGLKSAQRLALHLLRVPQEDALRLAEAIKAVRERQLQRDRPMRAVRRPAP